MQIFYFKWCHDFSFPLSSNVNFAAKYGSKQKHQTKTYHSQWKFHKPKQWIQRGLANFISKAKSVSKLDHYDNTLKERLCNEPKLCFLCWPLFSSNIDSISDAFSVTNKKWEIIVKEPLLYCYCYELTLFWTVI